MATFNYSDLLPEVLPSLAADPSDPVTEHAIKRAVIQFCSDSWIWRWVADPINSIAGESTYDLEPDSGADIAAVLRVSYDGLKLENKTFDWLDQEIPGWQATSASPKYFTQVDTEQIILAPVPESSVSNAISLTLALQPSQSSTTFPKWIYTQYGYQLAQGAMSYLMLMPDKGWSNPQIGAAYMATFQAAIASARADALASLGRATTRSKPQH